MKKQDEVLHSWSTFNKAEQDEPIFILRAQDRLAPDLIRLWITMARAQGTPQGKLDEAKLCAEAMEQWATRKYPD